MRAGSCHWFWSVLLSSLALCSAPAAIAAPDADAIALAGPDPGGRAAAAVRIARAGQCSDDAMRLLVTLLADPATAPSHDAGSATSAPTIGDLAAEALTRLGDPAVEAMIAALDDPARRDVHARIVDLLGRMAPTRAAAPVLRYITRHVAARTPWDAGISIAWLGRSATSALIQALGTDVLELQVVAARDLGDMGDPRALAPLLAVARRLVPLAAAMPAEYEQRRKIIVFRAAVPSIAKLGGTQTFDQIRRWQQSLSGCWDIPTRRALILAVAYTSDPRAATVLGDLLRDGDLRDRRAACEAVGLLAHPTRAAMLIGALDADDPIVRGHAVTALGILADPAAIDPLIGRLLDPSPEVRGRAAAALTGIAGVDLGLDPAAWRHWQDEYRKALSAGSPTAD